MRTEILNSKSFEQNVSTLFEPKFFLTRTIWGGGSRDDAVVLIMFKNSEEIKIIKCVCVMAHVRKSCIIDTSHLEYLLLVYTYAYT